MPTGPSSLLVLIALVAVQILFGLNYVISKVVVENFPPLVWANFRAIVSAVVLTLVSLALRRGHPKDGRKFFIPLIVFSLLGIIINQSSFLVGLRYTTATNSAILNTLIPVFTLIIVTLRGQEPLTLNKGVGFFFAFVGVLVIRKVENFTLSDKTLIGDLLTILNCLSYAIFLSVSRKFIQAHDRFWTTSWLFIYGSVGLTFLALPDWQTFQMPELTPMLIGCMVFAILGGTLMTYFLNNWALAYAKSSQVALFIYLQPIVAAILAFAWHGEVITLRTALSCGLIFVGVLMALSRRDLFRFRTKEQTAT